MTLAWLSDIHLNFLDMHAARRFVAGLASSGADTLVISGDIGEADSIVSYLRLFAEYLPGKTCFTLGNHDFYGESIAGVQDRVRRLAQKTPQLIYLTEAAPQFLNDTVALVGDDSWADARFGNALSTPVELNDFYLIEELSELTRPILVRTLNDLGDAAAARVAPKIDHAAVSCDCVVLVTHVPPFREAAWHMGRPSDADWVPWFACRAMGEVILRCARAHPAVRFLVLCGHTHSSGVYKPLKNVTVHTALARYGKPRIQRIFDAEWCATGRTFTLPG